MAIESVQRKPRMAKRPDGAQEIPLVSIVTVVRNGASDLEETINSVAVQTYPRIEHIVIDGGSNDGTVETIRRHQSRITFWSSEPDRGVYDAMNKGIAAATGEWITFLNAGDCYYDEKIIADIFTPARECEVDFVYGDVFTRDRDGSLLRRERARKFTKVALKRGIPAGHQTLFVRRSRCPRYDLRYEISADLDWAAAIFFSGPVRTCYFDERPIVYYRVGGLSSFRAKGSWEAIAIIARYFGIFDCILRIPLLLRWLAAAYVKRAFGITTFKLLLVRRKR